MLHNRNKELQSDINAIKQESINLQGLGAELESSKVKLNNVYAKCDEVALENDRLIKEVMMR